MGWTESRVSGAIRLVTGLAYCVDDGRLRRVPSTGPLFLVANHVNFLEAPLVFVRLRPRPVTGFAKAEGWDNGWMARLFNLGGAIPRRWGEGGCRRLSKGAPGVGAR
jgi:1-acyl-sn-glycerol-3-phosphate acyltransferase